jgi:hypothetical protein
LSQSPILKALSSIRKSGARTLLMGGQACVFYGAAEFSRDLDLLILSDADNLGRIRSALAGLDAVVIAVPPFEERHLLRGHAVHFRCRQPDVAGLRIDIMASLRGVAGFEELWERRTTIEVDGQPIDLLAMEDLVCAKKTQRDKDWAVQAALRGRTHEVSQALEDEQREHRRRDREYWEPLKRELEQLRQLRRRGALDASAAPAAES